MLKSVSRIFKSLSIACCIGRSDGEDGQEKVDEAIDSLGKVVGHTTASEIALGKVVGHTTASKIASHFKTKYPSATPDAIADYLTKECEKSSRALGQINALTKECIDHALEDLKAGRQALPQSKYVGDDDLGSDESWPDHVKAAALWVRFCSNSPTPNPNNELTKIASIISQYANGDSLSIQQLDEIHKALQIEKTGHRLAETDPTMPSDLSGHAILEKVLREPPAGNDQRALFLLASIVTAHGYSDGNGRVARIAYAAEQIGGQQLQGEPPVFVAPTPSLERSLSTLARPALSSSSGMARDFPRGLPTPSIDRTRLSAANPDPRTNLGISMGQGVKRHAAR